MSTIAKNKFQYSVDSFGTEVNVGDIIVYASGGTLYISQVLGFTELAIYVSVYKKPNNRWRYRNLDISEHNSKKYYRWLSFKVIEKNVPISELLKPYCYFHQMQNNGTI